MTSIIGLVTARGGSKSIPGKNIKLLGGKPLIAWSIEAALQAPSVGRVLASTDDPEIARIAAKWGAEVPFLRPAELAEDTTPSILVAEHALGWLAEHEGALPEYLLLLQPTSPFRTGEDIEAAATLARRTHADAVVSVTPVDQHPFFMKTLLPDGTMREFMTTDTIYTRRQDLPPVYMLNGAIYLNRATALLRDHNFQPAGTFAYIMPPERSLDLDTPQDWQVAEGVMRAMPADRHG